MSAPDVRLANYGSLCIFDPLTEAGQEWCERFLSHATRWAGGYVCEPRYVQPIIDGMEDDGLGVQT